jgi:O-antigen/teichoic acid export membrane protein
MIQRRKNLANVLVTIATAGVTRVATLASQIIVGLYLTDQELGAFAIAVGIIGVTCLLKGGGDAQAYLTLTERDFSSRAPAVFWWGTAFLLFGASLTLGTAAVLQTHAGGDGHNPPEIAPTLAWFGLRQLLTPFAQIGRIRMAVAGRFAALSKIDLASALIRVAMTWLLAAHGWGVYALVMPIVFQTLWEAATCIPIAKLSMRDFRWPETSLSQIWLQMRWPLLAAIFSSVNMQCGFLLAGLMVPVEVVGIFYFAFQLANTPRFLVSQSVQLVAGPAVATIAHDPAESLRVISTVLRSCMLILPMIIGLVGAVFIPLDTLAWGGRWAPALPSVVALSVGAAFAGASGIMMAPLIGLGRHRAIARIELERMTGLLAGICLGAWASRQPFVDSSSLLAPSDLLAIGTAAGMTISALVILFRVGRQAGLSNAELCRIVLFGPAVAALSVIAAMSIGQSFVQSATYGGLLIDIAHIVIALITYIALCLLTLRFLAEAALRDTVQLLPSPVRAPLSRVFFL